MNTRQYYQFAAHSYLNGSLIALLPILLIILPVSFSFSKKELLLLSIPFFLYSIYLFFLYVTNKQKAMDVFPLNEDRGKEQNKYLLLFLPGPTLNMQLYHPSGVRIGEIRDQYFWKIRWFLPYFIDKIFPSRYCYYDDKGKKAAIIIFQKNKIQIVFEQGEIVILKDSDGWYKIITNEKKWYVRVNKEKLFLDIRFRLIDGKQICRLRKGWMPLEWDEIFKDPNVPVLTMEEKLPFDLTLAIYSIVADFYRHYDH